jgi:hypothetical protein
VFATLFPSIRDLLSNYELPRYEVDISTYYSYFNSYVTTQVGISSQTDLKQGSMFWFTFPYRPDEQAATSPGSKLNTSDLLVTTSDLQVAFDLNDPTNLSENNLLIDDSPSVGSNLTVLLIDDSPSVLRVTSRFLLMNGHSVVTAANICACLDILKEASVTDQFDLLITNMQMPGMSENFHSYIYVFIHFFFPSFSCDNMIK